MTLHQLKAFATVAKLGSFTLAAENLRVRQPSVTLLVQSLEKELRVKLFEKIGHRSHLTVAGEKLQQTVDEILPKLDGIQEEMEEIKGLKKGKISVGGSGLAAASFLPLALQHFVKRYPGFQVVLKIERSRALEKKLLEGDLDLAILSRLPASPLLIAEPYREEEVVVIASPTHPLSRKRSVSLDLVAKERAVTYGKGTNVYDRVEEIFAEKGLALRTLLEVNAHYSRRDVVISTVANGFGIGFLSKCHVAPDIEAKRLSVLRVPELKVKRTMYLVMHKKRQPLSSIQAFVKFLRDYTPSKV